MRPESLEQALPSIRKSVTVPRSLEEAFALFTRDVASWWPLSVHSVGQEKARHCAIDPRVGGDFYEVQESDERVVWGEVLVWEPPSRVVFHWHAGRPADTAQELEVQFFADGDGTRVDLEHRDWFKLGDKAEGARGGYDTGWDFVMGEFVKGSQRG